MTVTIGSLCSGYGGLDMGLALGLGVPTRTAWHVEYDKDPSKIFAHRFPGVPNHGDVKTTDWAAVEPVEWLTAGYPCQPFSHAGLRKGADDPRHLWPGVARAISVLRPRNVLLENVRGHVSLGLDAVLADLAGLGYDASWGLVRASDAGAPHGRARIFILASDASRGGEQDGTLGGGQAGQHERPEPGAVRRDRPRGAAERVHLLGGTAAVVAADPTAADAGSGPLAGAAAARNGLRLAAERGAVAAPDADRGRLSLCAELHGHPAQDPADRDSRGKHADGPAGAVAWGLYEPAIRRWEQVTGRSAPRPTEPGRNGERLSPRFVEWMMGLPAGWVTDVPDLSRNAQLKALGNGVVPQQAALAVRLLTAQAVAA